MSFDSVFWSLLKGGGLVRRSRCPMDTSDAKTTPGSDGGSPSDVHQCEHCAQGKFRVRLGLDEAVNQLPRMTRKFPATNTRRGAGGSSTGNAMDNALPELSALRSSVKLRSGSNQGPNVLGLEERAWRTLPTDPRGSSAQTRGPGQVGRKAQESMREPLLPGINALDDFSRFHREAKSNGSSNASGRTLSQTHRLNDTQMASSQQLQPQQPQQHISPPMVANASSNNSSVPFRLADLCERFQKISVPAKHSRGLERLGDIGRAPSILPLFRNLVYLNLSEQASLREVDLAVFPQSLRVLKLNNCRVRAVYHSGYMSRREIHNLESRLCPSEGGVSESGSFVSTHVSRVSNGDNATAIGGADAAPCGVQHLGLAGNQLSVLSTLLFARHPTDRSRKVCVLPDLISLDVSYNPVVTLPSDPKLPALDQLTHFRAKGTPFCLRASYYHECFHSALFPQLNSLDGVPKHVCMRVVTTTTSSSPTSEHNSSKRSEHDITHNASAKAASSKGGSLPGVFSLDVSLSGALHMPSSVLGLLGLASDTLSDRPTHRTTEQTVFRLPVFHSEVKQDQSTAPRSLDQWAQAAGDCFAVLQDGECAAAFCLGSYADRELVKPPTVPPPEPIQKKSIRSPSSRRSSRQRGARLTSPTASGTGSRSGSAVARIRPISPMRLGVCWEAVWEAQIFAYLHQCGLRVPAVATQIPGTITRGYHALLALSQHRIAHASPAHTTTHRSSPSRHQPEAGPSRDVPRVDGVHPLLVFAGYLSNVPKGSGQKDHVVSRIARQLLRSFVRSGQQLLTQGASSTSHRPMHALLGRRTGHSALGQWYFQADCQARELSRRWKDAKWKAVAAHGHTLSTTTGGGSVQELIALLTREASGAHTSHRAGHKRPGRQRGRRTPSSEVPESTTLSPADALLVEEICQEWASSCQQLWVRACMLVWTQLYLTKSPAPHNNTVDWSHVTVGEVAVHITSVLRARVHSVSESKGMSGRKRHLARQLADLMAETARGKPSQKPRGVQALLNTPLAQSLGCAVLGEDVASSTHHRKHSAGTARPGMRGGAGTGPGLGSKAAKGIFARLAEVRAAAWPVGTITSNSRAGSRASSRHGSRNQSTASKADAGHAGTRNEPSGCAGYVPVRVANAWLSRPAQREWAVDTKGATPEFDVMHTFERVILGSAQPETSNAPTNMLDEMKSSSETRSEGEAGAYFDCISRVVQTRTSSRIVFNDTQLQLYLPSRQFAKTNPGDVLPASALSSESKDASEGSGSDQRDGVAVNVDKFSTTVASVRASAGHCEQLSTALHCRLLSEGGASGPVPSLERGKNAGAGGRGRTGGAGMRKGTLQGRSRDMTASLANAPGPSASPSPRKEDDVYANLLRQTAAVDAMRVSACRTTLVQSTPVTDTNSGDNVSLAQVPAGTVTADTVTVSGQHFVRADSGTQSRPRSRSRADMRGIGSPRRSTRNVGRTTRSASSIQTTPGGNGNPTLVVDGEKVCSDPNGGVDVYKLHAHTLPDAALDGFSDSNPRRNARSPSLSSRRVRSPSASGRKLRAAAEEKTGKKSGGNDTQLPPLLLPSNVQLQVWFYLYQLYLRLYQSQSNLPSSTGQANVPRSPARRGATIDASRTQNAPAERCEGDDKWCGLNFRGQYSARPDQSFCKFFKSAGGDKTRWKALSQTPKPGAVVLGASGLGGGGLIEVAVWEVVTEELRTEVVVLAVDGDATNDGECTTTTTSTTTTTTTGSQNTYGSDGVLNGVRADVLHALQRARRRTRVVDRQSTTRRRTYRILRGIACVSACSLLNALQNVFSRSPGVFPAFKDASKCEEHVGESVNEASQSPSQSPKSPDRVRRTPSRSSRSLLRKQSSRSVLGSRKGNRPQNSTLTVTSQTAAVCVGGVLDTVLCFQPTFNPLSVLMRCASVTTSAAAHRVALCTEAHFFHQITGDDTGPSELRGSTVNTNGLEYIDRVPAVWDVLASVAGNFTSTAPADTQDVLFGRGVNGLTGRGPSMPPLTLTSDMQTCLSRAGLQDTDLSLVYPKSVLEQDGDGHMSTYAYFLDLVSTPDDSVPAISQQGQWRGASVPSFLSLCLSAWEQASVALYHPGMEEGGVLRYTGNSASVPTEPDVAMGGVWVGSTSGDALSGAVSQVVKGSDVTPACTSYVRSMAHPLCVSVPCKEHKHVTAPVQTQAVSTRSRLRGRDAVPSEPSDAASQTRDDGVFVSLCPRVPEKHLERHGAVVTSPPTELGGAESVSSVPGDVAVPGLLEDILKPLRAKHSGSIEFPTAHATSPAHSDLLTALHSSHPPSTTAPHASPKVVRARGGTPGRGHEQPRRTIHGARRAEEPAATDVDDPSVHAVQRIRRNPELLLPVLLARGMLDSFPEALSPPEPVAETEKPVELNGKQVGDSAGKPPEARKTQGRRRHNTHSSPSKARQHSAEEKVAVEPDPVQRVQTAWWEGLVRLTGLLRGVLKSHFTLAENPELLTHENALVETVTSDPRQAHNQHHRDAGTGDAKTQGKGRPASFAVDMSLEDVTLTCAPDEWRDVVQILRSVASCADASRKPGPSRGPKTAGKTDRRAAAATARTRSDASSATASALLNTDVEWSVACGGPCDVPARAPVWLTEGRAVWRYASCSALPKPRSPFEADVETNENATQKGNPASQLARRVAMAWKACGLPAGWPASPAGRLNVAVSAAMGSSSGRESASPRPSAHSELGSGCCPVRIIPMGLPWSARRFVDACVFTARHCYPLYYRSALDHVSGGEYRGATRHPHNPRDGATNSASYNDTRLEWVQRVMSGGAAAQAQGVLAVSDAWTALVHAMGANYTARLQQLHEQNADSGAGGGGHKSTTTAFAASPKRHQRSVTAHGDGTSTGPPFSVLHAISVPPEVLMAVLAAHCEGAVSANAPSGGGGRRRTPSVTAGNGVSGGDAIDASLGVKVGFIRRAVCLRAVMWLAASAIQHEARNEEKNSVADTTTSIEDTLTLTPAHTAATTNIPITRPSNSTLTVEPQGAIAAPSSAQPTVNSLCEIVRLPSDFALTRDFDVFVPTHYADLSVNVPSVLGAGSDNMEELMRVCRYAVPTCGLYAGLLPWSWEVSRTYGGGTSLQTPPVDVRLRWEAFLDPLNANSGTGGPSSGNRRQSMMGGDRRSSTRLNAFAGGDSGGGGSGGGERKTNQHDVLSEMVTVWLHSAVSAVTWDILAVCLPTGSAVSAAKRVVAVGEGGFTMTVSGPSAAGGEAVTRADHSSTSCDLQHIFTSAPSSQTTRTAVIHTHNAAPQGLRSYPFVAFHDGAATSNAEAGIRAFVQSSAPAPLPPFLAFAARYCHRMVPAGLWFYCVELLFRYTSLCTSSVRGAQSNGAFSALLASARRFMRLHRMLQCAVWARLGLCDPHKDVDPQPAGDLETSAETHRQMQRSNLESLVVPQTTSVWAGCGSRNAFIATDSYRQLYARSQWSVPMVRLRAGVNVPLGERN